MLVRHAEKDAARLAEALAEFLATEADCGRVDDRQHAFDVAQEDGIEQRLVGILQAAQKDIARQVVRELPERLQATRDLLIQGCNIGREQAVQLEFVALLVGESRALVQRRVIQKLVTEEPRLNDRRCAHSQHRATSALTTDDSEG